MTYSSGRTWRTLPTEQCKRWESHKHIAIALMMHREMEMTYWLEKTEAEMAKLG